jgi:hypothetical protein
VIKIEVWDVILFLWYMGADVSEAAAVCMKTAGFFKIFVCIYETSCCDIPED